MLRQLMTKRQNQHANSQQREMKCSSTFVWSHRPISRKRVNAAVIV